MSGSYRASIGHNPKLSFKRAQPSLSPKSITLNLTTGTNPGIADFFIPAGTATVTFTGTATNHPGVTGPSRAVQPGDIIELAVGTHGRRNFTGVGRNTAAFSSNRVIIRNSSLGQTVIRSPTVMSGGFANAFNDCHNLDFDGSNSILAPLHPTIAGERIGFKFMYASNASILNKDNVTSFVKFQAANSTTVTTDNCTFTNFEIDGGWNQSSGQSLLTNGIGIQTNETNVQRADNPGMFQENMKFLNFVVRNLEGEGIYLGPNYANGTIPLRNIEVGYFYADMIGNDAAQGKSWFEGTNSIHDFIVERAARLVVPSGTAYSVGISSGGGRIYNGIVKAGGIAGAPNNGGAGIQQFVQNGPPNNAPPNPGYPTYATFTVEVFNCVSMDAAIADGIAIGGRSNSGLTQTICKVYNVTSVRNAGSGIQVSDNAHASSFVRNCIAVSNSGGQISATSQTNNTTTGSLASLFVNPGADNFHLDHELQATGTIGTNISATDIEGSSRTGTPSQGAYEFD